MKCSLVVFATTGSAFFLFATFSISSFAQRMPNHTLTPGHATYHTTETVCAAGSASDERMVPESEKNAVHQRYGIAKCQGYCSGPQGCEIDHLISLELGGANTSDNLWPQPYDGNWNAHDKDRLQARLHKLVCTDKTLTLKEAQQAIKADWVAAYKKYVGDRKTNKPVVRSAG